MAERFRASDGYEFAWRRYAAKADAKAQIVFVHGIRSHAGWYERSCTELAEKGFDVSFLDRRGAGANETLRGDCPSFRRLLDDVIEFVEAQRAGKPNVPIVLAGISWGGKVVLGAAARRPDIADGVVLIAPGIVPLVTVPLGQRVRIALSRFVRPAKMFPIPLNDPELFTASKHWQAFIEKDPLGLREATARLLFNSVQLDFYLKRNLGSVTCPVQLLSAGKDRIADREKSKALLASKLRPGLLTEIVYPNAEHTLEFEADCPFVSDIAAWCVLRR